VPGRTCGTCTLCCKVYPVVPDLDKPRSVWCPHCVAGKGCGIHVKRPNICRTFFCNWLLDEALGPEWKPERCKFVLHAVYYPSVTNACRSMSIPIIPTLGANRR